MSNPFQLIDPFPKKLGYNINHIVNINEEAMYRSAWEHLDLVPKLSKKFNFEKLIQRIEYFTKTKNNLGGNNTMKASLKTVKDDDVFPLSLHTRLIGQSPLNQFENKSEKDPFKNIPNTLFVGKLKYPITNNKKEKTFDLTLRYRVLDKTINDTYSKILKYMKDNLEKEYALILFILLKNMKFLKNKIKLNIYNLIKKAKKPNFILLNMHLN